jgi:peroxiredoxin
MKPLVFFLSSLLVLWAYGDDVSLEWISDGISANLGYYRPIKTELSAVKPARVTKLPENLLNPLFGNIALGPKESPVEAIILLDEPENGPARLWIDSNGNGDLTDDPPAKWAESGSKNKDGATTHWKGGGSLPVAYGKEQLLLGIKFYRFNKNDPERPQFKNTLFYYRDFGYLGNMPIAGKSFRAALIDDSSRGDFRPGGDVALLIDLNNNGRFERQGESFDPGKPFNIAGTTYEIAGLTARGSPFQLVKSSKTAEETPVLPVLETGSKPVAFEEKSTKGQNISFPSDYKGKIVLLDFWATWCGPCRAELPNIVKAYEEFHSRGFEVLGVSLDSEESMKKLSWFTAENRMPWPQICDGKGWKAKLARLYGVQGIPACWLIDGDSGLIVAMESELRGAVLRQTIERCLASLGKPTAINPAADAAKPDKAPVTQPEPAINPSAGALNPSKAPAAKPAKEDPIVAKARKLAITGKLATVVNFNTMRKYPKPAPVTLAAASTQPLPGREIATRAANAYIRAGWIYLCAKCNCCHVKLAGAYAIAGDTVVTAFHVMESPETIKQSEAYPVVVRGDDEIIPIVHVLAADEAMDAIILRVAAGDLPPLALSDGARVGDAAYCFSDPRGARGYFSSGIINRFYTRPGGSPDNPADQRFNVSVDWAPGSSGAAVLDGCANIIGHVARIQSILGDKKNNDLEEQHDAAAPAIMTLHEAVPAKGVLKIIEKMNSNAARTR